MPTGQQSGFCGHGVELDGRADGSHGDRGTPLLAGAGGAPPHQQGTGQLGLGHHPSGVIKLIDPAGGSGHFLLGAFRVLLKDSRREATRAPAHRSMAGLRWGRGCDGLATTCL